MERLARVQVEHKMTQSEEDPGHEVYPNTDAQIKLFILLWRWKAAFDVIDMQHYALINCLACGIYSKSQWILILRQTVSG